MDRTNDVKKNTVTIPMLIVMVAINTIISIAWALGIWNYSNTYKGNILTIFLGIPNLLCNLATFSLAIFGITIAKKGVFDKGGTEYYPTCYGENKLNNILAETDNYNDYEEVLKIISKLLNYKSSNTSQNEYFMYVFILQKTSDDFVKVWNDYNYYSPQNVQNLNNDYYKRLEKHIFVKVYEAYINDTKNKSFIQC